MTRKCSKFWVAHQKGKMLVQLSNWTLECALSALDAIWIGGIMGLISLLAGFISWFQGASEAYYRTMVFTVLTISQMVNALATRSEDYSLFQIKLTSNVTMLYSVLLTFALQIFIIYTPLGRELLSTEALSLKDFIIALGLSSVVFVLSEIVKYIKRARRT